MNLGKAAARVDKRFLHFHSPALSSRLMASSRVEDVAPNQTILCSWSSGCYTAPTGTGASKKEEKNFGHAVRSRCS